MRAGGRRRSRWPSAGRSRRSPSPPRLTTGCRSRGGACPSWRSSWWPRGWLRTSPTRAALLAAEGVSFQAVKTWKASRDLDYAAKKARVEHLYAIADGEAAAGPGGPGVTPSCVDEFGPLNLQPRRGWQWARRGGTAREPGEGPRRRWRATYTRIKGVRHLFAALSWAATRCTGTSRSASGAASSCSSAATCAACIRRACGPRSSATTSART